MSFENLELEYGASTLLQTQCEEYNWVERPFDPVEFAQALVKKMYELDLIGLAANQVGYPYRVFAMRGTPENFVCFNPRIIDQSSEQIVLEESCASFPGLIPKIKRPRHVKVRFELPNSDTRTETFTGLTARIFLHELSHLDGKMFFEDLVSRPKLELAIKRAKKLGFHYDGLLRFASK